MLTPAAVPRVRLPGYLPLSLLSEMSCGHGWCLGWMPVMCQYWGGNSHLWFRVSEPANVSLKIPPWLPSRVLHHLLLQVAILSLSKPHKSVVWANMFNKKVNYNPFLWKANAIQCNHWRFVVLHTPTTKETITHVCIKIKIINLIHQMS